MAIAPSELRPSFGEWIYSGYRKRSYSKVYVDCIHALKKNLPQLVDSVRADRLETYLKFVENPIYEDIEVSNDLISDLRYLRDQLGQVTDESVLEVIYGECAKATTESNWKSWIHESKTAIDMYLRYIHFRGKHSKLSGQYCYVRYKYRDQLEEEIDKAVPQSKNYIELDYDSSILIAGDNKVIKSALRGALTKFRVNCSYRITKVNIKINKIRLTFEQAKQS